MSLTEPAGPSLGARWLSFVLAAACSIGGFWLPTLQALLLLPLAITLYLAAAALALGHAPERRLMPTLGRRAPVALFWIVLLCAGIVALSAYPLQVLSRTGSLGAALSLSLALALAWLGLWRIWPMLALAFVDQPRRRGLWALLRHCLVEARRLVAADPSFSRGLLAALTGLLLLAGSMALLWLAADWPLVWRLSGALLWSLLVAPFLAFVILALVEPARLSAAASAPVQDPRVAGPAEPAAEPAAVPTLLPGDPTARLLAAARIGRIDDALAALEAGADPKVLPGREDRDQRSLAMLAAVLSDTRLLRRLIAAGVDVNQRHAGLTPLLAATRDSLRGRPDAVMTLLANGADPRLTDAEGRTPLHFAALVSEPDVAALLLDAGAPIEALNQDGYSPLGVACASGNWRIARFLLERKARPEPANGQPALLAAAAGEDDPAGVELLLRFKAKPDARGRLGRTAMLSAALAGNEQIVAALLAAGADPDLADDHGVSPLLEAARAGANGVLQHLPEGQLALDACDHSGRNALLLACQSPRANAETVKRLLQLGVDPRQPAADGRTALECAVAMGRWPLVRALDPQFPIPTAHGDAEVDPLSLQAVVDTDDRPWPARLDEALAEHDLSRVGLIVRSVQPAAAELFEIVLRQAPRIGDAAMDRLLDGFDRAWFEQHPSPLQQAFSPPLTGLIRALRRRGVSVGGLRLAALLQALLPATPEQNDETVVIDLLAAGADGLAPVDGAAPLNLAIRLGWARLAEALLLRGADPNRADAQGLSPLHRAAAAGDEHLVALLLRFGAHIDRRSREGCSAFGIALRHGCEDVLDWLDWRGWSLPRRALRDTDLVSAAASGDAAAVERLLALGLAIEARDSQGATALMRACGGGHLAAVRLLIARGADLQASAHSGATSLSAAISMRHRTVVEALLNGGADVDQSLPGGVTPLMVAAALGLPEMLVMLLDRGADPSRADDQGNRAIHALAQFGFTARDKSRVLACWRALLDGGGNDADAAGADQLSPLLLLLGARTEPGHPLDDDCLRAQLELLLAQQVDLGRRDARGFGPLHLCALHGQLGLLRRLLLAGADREARDSLNRRAQDIAVMRGFVDLAAELGPTGGRDAAPSMARFLKQPGE